MDEAQDEPVRAELLRNVFIIFNVKTHVGLVFSNIFYPPKPYVFSRIISTGLFLKKSSRRIGNTKKKTTFDSSFNKTLRDRTHTARKLKKRKEKKKKVYFVCV